MGSHQRWLGPALACVMCATPVGSEPKAPLMRSTAAQLPIEGQLPSIDGAVQWLNSPPLSAEGLRGRVVLIDFWTYTCVNWRRTLPYLRAWAERYKDAGLVVIGVHTPEFDIEKDVDSIRNAVSTMRIEYPIAIDSDYRIWRAFDNRYWPALYLVDAEGRIRHHQFGEGEYEQSEFVIQQLLAEAGKGSFSVGRAPVDPDGFELAADSSELKSPESYIGYERAEGFASPGGAVPGERHAYAFPARLRLNEWALAGDWVLGPEAAVLKAPNGRLTYRFHARDLNLIMGPAVRGVPVHFRVLIDGHSPGTAHGLDVDGDGVGSVTETRMYQLIRQTKPIADRQFEIEFLNPGVAAFDFTFG